MTSPETTFGGGVHVSLDQPQIAAAGGWDAERSGARDESFADSDEIYSQITAQFRGAGLEKRSRAIVSKFCGSP